jgi:glucosamine kinase
MSLKCKNNTTANPYWLGIDGGGSKCKAVLVNQQGDILGEGIAGPGNPIHGFEQATKSIIESATIAITQAKAQDAQLRDLSLADIPAGVGLAGVNLPHLRQQMLDWHHPFAEFYLTTDLQIACLGAHDGQDGGVIITGTGSCGFSYVKGQGNILGAHGFPHGDKASGAWIGLEIVKKVLLTCDELAADTTMKTVLFSYLNCSDATELVTKIAHYKATDYAKLAFIGFDQAKLGDEQASLIIQEAATYVEQLADKIWQFGAERLSLIGGIAKPLSSWLAPHVEEKVKPAKMPPEIGAVLYAQQQNQILN